MWLTRERLKLYIQRFAAIFETTFMKIYFNWCYDFPQHVLSIGVVYGRVFDLVLAYLLFSGC